MQIHHENLSCTHVDMTGDRHVSTPREGTAGTLHHIWRLMPRPNTDVEKKSRTVAGSKDGCSLRMHLQRVTRRYLTLPGTASESSSQTRHHVPFNSAVVGRFHRGLYFYTSHSSDHSYLDRRCCPIYSNFVVFLVCLCDSVDERDTKSSRQSTHPDEIMSNDYGTQAV